MKSLETGSVQLCQSMWITRKEQETKNYPTSKARAVPDPAIQALQPAPDDPAPLLAPAPPLHRPGRGLI